MWYIAIEGKTEGPFSFIELRKDTRLTPDTFAWREGFNEWKKIRDIPELLPLFEESELSDNDEDAESDVLKPTDEEIALDGSLQPPYFVWLFIATFIFLYFLFKTLW